MGINRRFRALVDLLTLTLLMSFSSTAHAQMRVREVYAFPPELGPSDRSELIQASDGNFYGTAATGYAGGHGAVFRVTPDGRFTVVHAFTGGSDGAQPLAPVVQGSDGYLYGTTELGGPSNRGTIFRMTLDGQTTILRAFDGGCTVIQCDGEQPRTALVEGADGNFYGTTEGSDSSQQYGDVMIRMTPSGNITVLHRFQWSSQRIDDRLLQASDGNFYGVQRYGGDIGYGAIFRMTPGGAVTVLYAFTGGLDGGWPAGGLIQGTDGYLYGTTTLNGLYGGNSGTAFRMTLSGTVTMLHSFNRATGIWPQARLTQANDGYLYGVTEFGGKFNYGTLFRLTSDGDFNVLYDFTNGINGGNPTEALVQGADGNLYGITCCRGRFGSGEVFSVRHGFNAATNDFDGDARTDLAVFRPWSGIWYILNSSTEYDSATSRQYQWGLPGDIPISGDFDGDGKVDLAVWRPPTGMWYLRYSSLGYSPSTVGVYQWGLPGDVPLAGDFDGDGIVDLTVWRPSTGMWYLRYSSRGYSLSSVGMYQWGLPGDIPLAGDFDGDGQTDLAVFRPLLGGWFILYSSHAYSVAASAYFQWGLPGDIPLMADFDNDGRTELTVFRPSIGGWFVRYSSSGFSDYAFYQWGLPEDVPMAGDFDGDGKTDLAVFRPSSGNWFICYSTLGYDIGRYGLYQWGLDGDLPVTP